MLKLDCCDQCCSAHVKSSAGSRQRPCLSALAQQVATRRHHHRPELRRTDGGSTDSCRPASGSGVILGFPPCSPATAGERRAPTQRATQHRGITTPTALRSTPLCALGLRSPTLQRACRVVQRSALAGDRARSCRAASLLRRRACAAPSG